MGGWSKYGWSPKAHANETSRLITLGNRLKLYAEWRRYWNVSRPVLVEKSPIHTMKTRFLQAMFGPNNTFFVVVIRHPFPSMQVQHLPYYSTVPDCVGLDRMKHWLHVHTQLFEDLQHLHNYVLIRFEDVINSVDPNGMCDSCACLQPLQGFLTESWPRLDYCMKTMHQRLVTGNAGSSAEIDTMLRSRRRRPQAGSRIGRLSSTTGRLSAALRSTSWIKKCNDLDTRFFSPPRCKKCPWWKATRALLLMSRRCLTYVSDNAKRKSQPPTPQILRVLLDLRGWFPCSSDGRTRSRDKHVDPVLVREGRLALLNNVPNSIQINRLVSTMSPQHGACRV
jgi:hypothetical protein